MTDATPDGQTELGGDTVEEMSEILDLNVTKMSAVGLPANGTRFLIAKAQAEGRGLFDAQDVRDLANPQEHTVTDTAAAVAKADGTAEAGDLDASTLLAEPASAAPGGGSDMPGSAGWESVDAATANKWAEIFARGVAAINLLASREGVEYATGAEDDKDAVYDLEDAACAAEFAMGTLASFALSENLEAVTEAGDMEVVMKAAADLERPVAFIETIAPVIKAGRTLSAANEAAIRAAIASLTNVINTLPAPTPDAAPAAVAKSTKETDVTATETVTTGSPELDAAVVKSTQDAIAADVVKGTAAAEPVETVDDETGAEVAKAKGDPMVAVYDEEGALVGMVKPTDITPIQSASKSGDDTPSGDDAPTDLVPAPADAAGVPADAAMAAAPIPAPAAAVAKSEPADADTETLTALVVKAVNEAREEDRAALQEQAEVIKGLQTRIDAQEQAPAPSKVLTNGAPIPPHLNRHTLSGPTHGSTEETAERGRVMKAELSTMTDAREQKTQTDAMNEAAMAELLRIQGRQPAQR